MSGSIPNEFIDQLLNNVDIVDIVGRHVRLKKAGKDFSGLCPFHNEKSPSFTVSPTKQFFHCFGCGAHGSAIGFIMQHENLAFVDAVEDLAHAANMQIPRSSKSNTPRDSLEPLWDASKEAATVYYRQLQALPKDSAPWQYLSNRGITQEAIKRFGIGFAPDEWNTLFDRVSVEKKPALSKAGLIVTNDAGKQYDRFRNRLMFPIRDRKGHVIAFGGRVLDDSKPKYLNSPESPIFHKGRELYGLFEAQQDNNKLEYLLITEGYMDVVSLNQHGITNAIATLGTALTTEHGKRLSRLTNQIIFCFDGDRAGQAAAWRALENMLPVLRGELSIRFLMLPEGEDPDSLVQKEGRDAFERRINQANSLPEYLSERLSAKYDRNSMEGRAHLLAAAEPILANIVDDGYKAVLTEHIAALANTSIDLVRKPTVPASTSPDNSGQPSQRRAKAPARGEFTRTPIRVAIALLLQHPDILTNNAVIQNLINDNDPGIEVLQQLADYIARNSNATTGMILENWRNHAFSQSLAKLASWEHLVPENGIAQEFTDAIGRLEKSQFLQRLDDLQTKLETDGLSSDEKQEYRELLQTRSSVS